MFPLALRPTPAVLPLLPRATAPAAPVDDENPAARPRPFAPLAVLTVLLGPLNVLDPDRPFGPKFCSVLPDTPVRAL